MTGTKKIGAQEMEELVRRTKETQALECALIVFRNKVSSRWGELNLAEWTAVLEEARQRSDARMIDQATKQIDVFTGAQREDEGILEFLEEIAMGTSPSDWNAKPDWSREHSYAALFRRYAARWISVTLVLRDSSIRGADKGKPLTEKFLKEFFGKYTTKYTRRSGEALKSA